MKNQCEVSHLITYWPIRPESSFKELHESIMNFLSAWSEIWQLFKWDSFLQWI